MVIKQLFLLCGGGFALSVKQLEKCALDSYYPGTSESYSRGYGEGHPRGPHGVLWFTGSFVSYRQLSSPTFSHFGLHAPEHFLFLK